ncbi:MAG: cadmium-translocating P-type ATPase [Clostridia bacterium]|nr:cadmium-translocating P-type ATPase [Clostridia bacterium]
MHNHEHEHHHEHGEEGLSKTNKILMLVGIVLTVIAFFLSSKFEIAKYLFIIAYVLIGYDIILKAIKHLFGKDMFDENLIMTIATIGAVIIGQYTEGIAVLVLYKIGELLQDKAVDLSKDKIKKVLDLKVNETTLKDGKTVHTEDVKIGDVILVKTGDRIPLDCILQDEAAQLDMSALNGESMYVDVNKGKEILAGSINVGSAIYLEVIREEKDSAVSKIIELVNNASKNKSKTEKYISKFCKIYTPVVILIAILLPFILNVELKEAVYRSLNFLVISCPCALVISIPLGFFVGMGAASKKGILAKGTVYLDKLANIDSIYLDKTGTLTDGKFKVDNIKSVSDYTMTQILEYVAIAESKSNHVIATSILEKYGADIDQSRITSHEEISGYGIKATIDGNEVLCGNFKLLNNNKVTLEKEETRGAIVYLAVNGEYKGYITLADTTKEGAKILSKALHKRGIKEVVMLTGDRRIAAQKVANEVGVDNVYYELLPQDKLRIIEDAKNTGRNVAFVGDGINDGPVIAMADVGIAMGKGSDIAVETADIVLMTDEPEKIIEAIDISRRTKRIVNQNIVVILLTKIAFLICSVLGITSMWIAVFADVGITILAIFNALRIFRTKK